MALQFDLSAIPAGATIESATLSLYCFQDPNPSLAVPYEVHQVTSAWNETEATWTNATSTQAWLSAGSGGVGGGDYRADMIDTVTFPPNSTNLWNSLDVTTAAQAFVDNPAANYGIILFSLQHSGEGSQWYSSECAIDSLRPKVTVTYTTTSIRHQMVRAPLRGAGSGSPWATFAPDGRSVPTGAAMSSGRYLLGPAATPARGVKKITR